MAKYIKCDKCNKTLSGDDDVWAVNDNAVYGKYCSQECLAASLQIGFLDLFLCSQECLEDSSRIEWTDAKMYIEDAERLNEADDVYDDEDE